jgi:hypothetical protein
VTQWSRGYAARGRPELRLDAQRVDKRRAIQGGADDRVAGLIAEAETGVLDEHEVRQVHDPDQGYRRIGRSDATNGPRGVQQRQAVAAVLCRKGEIAQAGAPERRDAIRGKDRVPVVLIGTGSDLAGGRANVRLDPPGERRCGREAGLTGVGFRVTRALVPQRTIPGLGPLIGHRLTAHG